MLTAPLHMKHFLLKGQSQQDCQQQHALPIPIHLPAPAQGHLAACFRVRFLLSVLFSLSPKEISLQLQTSTYTQESSSGV